MATAGVNVPSCGWRIVPQIAGEKRIQLINIGRETHYAVCAVAPTDGDLHPRIGREAHAVDIPQGEKLYVLGPCVITWVEML